MRDSAIADEISVYRRFYGASLIREEILISRKLLITIGVGKDRFNNREIFHFQFIMKSRIIYMLYYII